MPVPLVALMQCNVGSPEVTNTRSPTPAAARVTGKPVENFQRCNPLTSCIANTSPSSEATITYGWRYDGGATISAPALKGPVGGTQLDTLRPTLEVTNAVTTGTPGAVTYRFEASELDTFPADYVFSVRVGDDLGSMFDETEQHYAGQ